MGSLKNHSIILILALYPACAATTTVTGPALTFDESPFTGSIVINSPRMTTASGGTIIPWSKTYAVTNGAFSASFSPNDTATPSGTSYSVQYRPSQGSAFSESWIVPTSASPVTIATVRVFNAVTPSLTLSLSQLSGVGVAKGAIPCFSTLWTSLAHGTNTYVLTADSTQTCGIKWAANSGGGGGGTWGSITGTLSDQTDLATALSLKAALTANTFTRGQVITGSADEVQWDITCNATQTNPCARIRKSDGTVFFQVNNDGSVQMGSGTGPATINTITIGSAPSSGKFNYGADSSGFFGQDSTNAISRLVPPLPSDATKFLDGTGAFSTPAGGGSNTPGAWQNITGGLFLNSWTQQTSADTVGYRLEYPTRVCLRGVAKAGNVSGGFAIFNIAAGWRQASNHQDYLAPAGGVTSSTGVISITSGGDVNFYPQAGAGGAYADIGLQGICFATN